MLAAARVIGWVLDVDYDLLLTKPSSVSVA